MFWMFVFLGIALVAAVMVFLFASVVTRMGDADGRRGAPVGLKSFWRDFRSGLTGWRRPSQERPVRGSEAPIDTGMEEFFAATEVDDPAYIDADEISVVLQRAKERAAQTLHSAGVRRSHPGPVPAADRSEAPRHPGEPQL